MSLEIELAQLAARHIAEEGLSYGEAKAKAAKQVGVAQRSAAMPSNQAIEQALRKYQALYMADSQPSQLLALRCLALKWLEQLAALEGLQAICLVLATGAVVNGTASEHSPVHLQVFTDEDKYFEIALLNAGYSFEHTQKSVNGLDCPVWVIQERGIPIVLTLLPRQRYKTPAAVGASEYPQAANAAQLRAIMALA